MVIHCLLTFSNSLRLYCSSDLSSTAQSPFKSSSADFPGPQRQKEDVNANSCYYYYNYILCYYYYNFLVRVFSAASCPYFCSTQVRLVMNTIQIRQKYITNI